MTKYSAEYWDHRRDERKHDFPPLKPIPTAVEVAMLVKSLSNVAAAADLIEQYAQTVAAGARLEGVELTSNRILAAIESPASSKEPSDAQA